MTIHQENENSDSPLSRREVLSRRNMLLQAGGGFGSLALAGLLSQSAAAESDRAPLSAKVQHHSSKAKRVIFLFMEGGPSHIDLFDPKPALQDLAGKSLPKSFKPLITPMGEFNSPVLPDQRKWHQHGESGLWISDWLPYTAMHADSLSVIRSCWTNGINHSGGICQMNTGVPLAGRPSLGSWVTYGLGSENNNLPAYVVIKDSRERVVNGPRNWSAGFMPAVYQGTLLQGKEPPIANLKPPKDVAVQRQERKLAFIQQLNRHHADARPDDSFLDARIRSYELAYRMQAEAPAAVDLSQETAETKRLYGMHQKETSAFGRNCLLARRLVERGVRFVQLYHGAGNKWDAHTFLEQNHTSMCRQMDWPVAGLLTDLKRRGLLDETLVIWGGEFGRTPMSEKGNGRDHNPWGFSMWMAGGGVKRGQAIGTTDEVGLHAVDDRLHVHDLHATVLYLMGIDHRELIYVHKGRPERIDLNEGSVCKKLLA